MQAHLGVNLVHKMALASCFLGCMMWETNLAHGLTFDLPQNGDTIVGQMHVVRVQTGDNLFSIARRYDVGTQAILAANPGLNHLKVGAKIIIPTAFILPGKVRQGLVINLAELRLYYYPQNSNKVMIFPIGIGREGWETPLADTTVANKINEPFWYPPESIRKYTLQTKGYMLPEAVPPGGDNPLGDYAIFLALPGYLIHGTNAPRSIGDRSSSGCIRLYPEDITQLFAELNFGDPVHIIHQPYKIGLFHNELYLEAHKPLPEYGVSEPLEQQLNGYRGASSNIDWLRVKEVAKNLLGFPVFIGNE